MFYCHIYHTYFKHNSKYSITFNNGDIDQSLKSANDDVAAILQKFEDNGKSDAIETEIQ